MAKQNDENIKEEEKKAADKKAAEKAEKKAAERARLEANIDCSKIACGANTIIDMHKRLTVVERMLGLKKY